MKIRSLTKRIKRKDGEKMDGLKLLLLFAYGPLKTKVCGSNIFAKKVKKYLEGDWLMEQVLKNDLPEQLKTAWPNLLKIAERQKKNPLSLEIVRFYIFRYHNLFASPHCKVKAGIVRKIDKKKKRILVATRDKEILRINFLSPYEEDIKSNDFVAFHHNWLISKINTKQFNALSR